MNSVLWGMLAHSEEMPLNPQVRRLLKHEVETKFSTRAWDYLDSVLLWQKADRNGNCGVYIPFASLKEVWNTMCDLAKVE